MIHPMRYCFAYGSNMHAPQMAERCPRAIPCGKARLVGWRFLINSRGVATIARDRGCVVWGALWKITPADEKVLDACEGVADGCYRKLTLNVEGRECLVYVSDDCTPSAPRAGYLEKILLGAESFDLPTSYLAQLADWATRKPCKPKAKPSPAPARKLVSSKPHDNGREWPESWFSSSRDRRGAWD